MEKDPVCGMLVRPEKAVAQRTHEGRTYCFCSTDCLKKFDEAPGRYVGLPADPSALPGSTPGRF